MTPPSPHVTVVDYGVGNLHSVVKGLRHEGAEVKVTSDPRDVERSEWLVLPGVGAFADGMRGLESRNLIEPLLKHAASGRPFLGICLGMQLLMGESDEFGSHRGLGLVPGTVRLIARSQGVKVPHVGWNRIAPRSGCNWRGTVLADVPENSMMYFVHSFAAEPEREGHRLADTLYGGARVSAAIQREHVVGCQFHPEKSGPGGLKILSRFLSVN